MEDIDFGIPQLFQKPAKEILFVNERQQKAIHACQIRLWHYDFSKSILNPYDLWRDFQLWFQFPWQYPIRKEAEFDSYRRLLSLQRKKLGASAFYPVPYCGNCSR
jgi:hypothetical protein